MKAITGFRSRPSRRSLTRGFFASAFAVASKSANGQAGPKTGPLLALPSIHGVDGVRSIDWANPAAAAPMVFANGYWEPGDHGGGRLVWDPDAADPVDDFLVFAPRSGFRGRWRRVADPLNLSFEMAGAKGDGVTDDFLPCQKLLRSAARNFGQCRVLLQPNKAYLIDYNLAGVQDFALRPTSLKAGALVVPNHCVIEGPGGALGLTAKDVPDLAAAARLLLHPKMTLWLMYFAELRNLQILRKNMEGEVDHFSPSGPTSIEDMQAQLELWLREDGKNPEVNGGVRSIAITNGGVDTKVNRVLAMGFHTAYLSNGYGRPVVDELYFDTAGRGVEITRCADDALIRGCYCNAFWSSALGSLRNHKGNAGARPGIAFDFHDQCDGLRCVDCSAIGFAIGFRLSNVWSVMLDAPNAEPAGQPANTVTHGIIAEDSVSHTTILNPLIDGFTNKLNFQHRPVAQTNPSGALATSGPGQYGTASIAVIGGSLQGNESDPPEHRAIRLGPGSSGAVVCVNLAGFPRNSAVLAEHGTGIWKFIGVSPSLNVRQPTFEFADRADQSRILRIGCDPIDGTTPPALSLSGPIVMTDLPTSPTGLVSGTLWRDGNDIKVV